MDVDSERRRKRRVSREFSEAMKDISGMDVNEQDRALNFFEGAMRKGRASFTSDGTGGGTLSVGDEQIKIKDTDEASLYLGIQQKASSKKT